VEIFLRAIGLFSLVLLIAIAIVVWRARKQIWGVIQFLITGE